MITNIVPAKVRIIENVTLADALEFVSTQKNPRIWVIFRKTNIMVYESPEGSYFSINPRISIGNDSQIKSYSLLSVEEMNSSDWNVYHKVDFSVFVKFL